MSVLGVSGCSTILASTGECRFRYQAILQHLWLGLSVDSCATVLMYMYSQTLANRCCFKLESNSPSTNKQTYCTCSGNTSSYIDRCNMLFQPCKPCNEAQPHRWVKANEQINMIGSELQEYVWNLDCRPSRVHATGGVVDWSPRQVPVIDEALGCMRRGRPRTRIDVASPSGPTPPTQPGPSPSGGHTDDRGHCGHDGPRFQGPALQTQHSIVCAV